MHVFTAYEQTLVTSKYIRIQLWQEDVWYRDMEQNNIQVLWIGVTTAKLSPY